MNVLVVAPHPDDEAIGCGGTVAAHVARGDRVAVVFLTSGERGLSRLELEDARRVREGEAARSCEVLGVAAVTFVRLPDWMLWGHQAEISAACAAVLDAERSELVYVPHPGEWHPDHQACLPALRAAIAECGISGCSGRAYEVWTPLQMYRHVEDISSTIARKLRAIRCHESQLAQFRYDQAARGLGRYRGVTTQKGRYCEVFAALDLGVAATPAPDVGVANR